ncbi:GGDEF domain-containing protein [Niveibacterium umoris]|uniref:diguanylate cyclase n=1 Tax=Niveibacterium umoris TaxID=1193620 RepID=A0A840BJT8_9RHOO|nr:GGDEF domain-containing protein [Niveibacterium umoris]MBB4011872.1 diguanylate cyclase (GGDEF)-like protein [Niveibacterium umoris]
MQASGQIAALDLVGEAIHELLQASRSLLAVPVADSMVLQGFDAYGRLTAEGSDPLLLHFARRATKHGRPLSVTALDRDALACAGSSEWAPDSALSAVPFPGIGQSGALCLIWRDARAMRDGDIPLIRHIGQLATAALVNAKLREGLEQRIKADSESSERTHHAHAEEITRHNQTERELHRLSVTDIMTGLLNRRGFEFYASQSLSIAREQYLQGLLLFADINDLKRVNDAYGHERGDELIQDCAGVLRDAFRKSDVVARLGGDEFAVFSVDAESPDAVQQRVDQRLKAFAETHARPYPISMSIGVLECPSSSDESLTQMLAQADRLMYTQKRSSAPRRATNVQQ